MSGGKKDKSGGDESAIAGILNRVTESVHKLDYEGVRDFIPDDGVYFGSVATMAKGFEELYEKQFSKVWPRIDNFTIVESSVSIHTSDTFSWATCLFESSVTDPDGNTLERKGRMTFIFERRNNTWQMVHSHDSLYPEIPAKNNS